MWMWTWTLWLVAVRGKKTKSREERRKYTSNVNGWKYFILLQVKREAFASRNRRKHRRKKSKLNSVHFTILSYRGGWEALLYLSIFSLSVSHFMNLPVINYGLWLHSQFYNLQLLCVNQMQRCTGAPKSNVTGKSRMSSDSGTVHRGRFSARTFQRMDVWAHERRRWTVWQPCLHICVLSWKAV
jgi:hypothetical protein